jgi:hypothetical protein
MTTTTIILLPASVVAKLAPTFAQRETQDALSIFPLARYWKRLSLAMGHSAAAAWGHSRLRP